MNKVRPIPEGFNTVTPYLFVNGAAAAIAFYKKAFGAIQRFHMNGPNDKITHAEIMIGNSIIMLADEMPEIGAKSPEMYGGSPCSLMIYVEDVDAVFRQAVEAGATVIRPVENQFYGDRSGYLKDPFGHTWCIATHIEDLSSKEIDERFEVMKAERNC